MNHFLHTYSQSTKPFTVIQVGANDGITHDPIHKYIKRDKWQGVTLEPQPDVYNQYLKKIYHNNEGLETLCAAIGEKDGYQKLYKVAFSKMRWATGLASFERQNLQKAFENGYVKLNCDKYGVEYPSSTEKHITEVSIKVISPATLLNQYNIENIDLLQIDTEGYDFEVIKLFEIQNTQPKVIIFENAHLSANHSQECHGLLLKNKYAIKQFGANTVAMKKPLVPFEKVFQNNY